MSPNVTLHLPVTVTRLLLLVPTPNLHPGAVGRLLPGAAARRGPRGSLSPVVSSPLGQAGLPRA